MVTAFTWPWHPLVELPEGVTFLAYQQEKCPETDKLHMQIYVQFEKPGRYMAKIKEIFGQTCHVETMVKGSTPQKCYAYVTKEESRQDGPWELGTLTKAGQRSDLSAFREAIVSGASNNRLATDHFTAYLRYHKSIGHIRAVLTPIPPPRFSIESFEHPRLDLTKATVLVGPTECGKTQFALAHFQRPLLVTHLDDLGNLTAEHDGIVGDDLDFSHLHFSAVINILDMDTARSVHIRYTVAHLPRGLPRIFTTNKSEIFGIQCTDEQRAAIDRRLNIVTIYGDIRRPPMGIN